ALIVMKENVDIFPAREYSKFTDLVIITAMELVPHKIEEKAFELHSKAAETENISPQYNLGWYYQNGWGTTKHLEKAVQLYLKEARANNLHYDSDFPGLKDILIL
ncbi:hypothetical protein G9A89_000015, partial [Geosiphon pyriformis]